MLNSAERTKHRGKKYNLNSVNGRIQPNKNNNGDPQTQTIATKPQTAVNVSLCDLKCDCGYIHICRSGRHVSLRRGAVCACGGAEVLAAFAST